MTIAWWLIGTVVLCFSLVVLVGPPYLPTLKPQVAAALDMLDLKPGQTMIELGCGDGVVLLAAAQRGWQVVGIELNPLLVLVCKVRTWRYRKQVKVVWGNYWNLAVWPPAEGIFGFVLPRLMTKLDASIVRWRKQQGKALAKPVRLASFAFAIPDKPAKQERDGVLLYEY